MQSWEWLSTGAGVVIVLLVLVDVFLTVLHQDQEGPLAWCTFHVTWRVVIALGRAVPPVRRSMIALAGPTMIVLTVALWLGLFVLGFALIYLPHMSGFRVEHQLLGAGFLEALYYSGGTATVLGFGDITPLGAYMQTISIVQAAVGLAMMTSIFTYVINVVAGAADRNTLALRSWIESGRTGDGVESLLRSLRDQDVGDTRARLESLLYPLQRIQQMAHKFPVLDFFYRSRDPLYSPEALIEQVGTLGAAARVAASDPGLRRLRPVASEVTATTFEVIRTIARQHLPRRFAETLDRPEPGEADRAELERIRDRLRAELPERSLELGEEERRDLLQFLARMRIFLDEIDRRTDWRSDRQPAPR